MKTSIPTLNDIDFKDKKVLLRVDYNVPIKNGKIQDDTRIKASLPTIKELIKRKAKQIIILTHIGRPKKKEEELSTKKIAKRLEKLLNKKVAWINDCININMPKDKIVMLENVRYYSQEEKNEEKFSKKLAENAEIFVNDAFGTAHREHASTVGVTKYLEGCIGLLIQKELKYLQFEKVKRPFIIILGGAKLATKTQMIQKLLTKADKILLGGAMIFTFYKAQGKEIGKSLLDKKNILLAKMLLNNEKIKLPYDVVVAKNPDDYKNAKRVSDEEIPKNQMGLDIGEDSTDYFITMIQKAKTIVWNGPLGYVEQKPFDTATTTIMKEIAKRTEKGATTIIGGGDSIKIVEKLKLKDQFTHVSTGGGASLAMLEGKELPALKALRK